MNVGRRIKEARAAVGLSAIKIDDLAGLARGHTWQIESGKLVNPGVKTLEKIATVLGISVSDLTRQDTIPPDGVEPIAAAVGQK